jgi:DNA-binding NarL/FixJ family response regulator
MAKVNPESPGTSRSSSSVRRFSRIDHGRKQILFVERKRIILVEVHPLFRAGLALLLEWRMGFERVLGDRSGAVDLAIVDLDLLEGGGRSVIASIREAEPNVPVLALTASESRERQAQALEAGADEVLNLAADIEEVIGAVERLASG